MLSTTPLSHFPLPVLLLDNLSLLKGHTLLYLFSLFAAPDVTVPVLCCSPRQGAACCPALLWLLEGCNGVKLKEERGAALPTWQGTRMGWAEGPWNSPSLLGGFQVRRYMKESRNAVYSRHQSFHLQDHCWLGPSSLQSFAKQVSLLRSPAGQAHYFALC